MAVKITGGLSSPIDCEIVHESGAKFETIAPKDNGGDGSKFSPTDLVVAAVGSCICTIAGLYARSNAIHLKSMKFDLTKNMGTNPRHIASIKGKFVIDSDCDPQEFERLVAAARDCPVSNSLGPNTSLEIEFVRG